MNKILKYMEKYSAPEEVILEFTGITSDVFQKIIAEEIVPDKTVRHKIEMLLGEDTFPDINKYNEYCLGCERKCKQWDWVVVVQCKQYKPKRMEEF